MARRPKGYQSETEPLHNERWEKFCVNVASGMAHYKSYMSAGFDAAKPTAVNRANLLMRKSLIKRRIAWLERESKATAAEKIAVDRAWVLDKNKQIIELGIKEIQVTDRHGEVIGTRMADGSAAVRAVELMGREFGMYETKATFKHQKADPLDGMSDEQVLQLLRETVSEIPGVALLDEGEVIDVGDAESGRKDADAASGDGEAGAGDALPQAPDLSAVSEAEIVPRRGGDVPREMLDGGQPAGEDLGGGNGVRHAPDRPVPAVVEGEEVREADQYVGFWSHE